MAGLTGTVYAPSAQLVLSGNANLKDTLIVDTLSISGNAIAQLAAAERRDGLHAGPDPHGLRHQQISSLDGTGQTIAIVDAYDDPQIYQALDTFDSQFGLTNSGPTLYQQYGPATSFLTVLNQNGQPTSLPGTDPVGPGNDNWEVEEALDVEWAHAIAPGAKIILVEANSQSLADLMAGVATAASQPGVSVVSMSWGFAEGQGVSAADEATYDSTLRRARRDLRGQHGRLRRGRSRLPRLLAQRAGGRRHQPHAQRRQLLQQRNAAGAITPASLGTFIGSGGGLSQYEAEPAYQQRVQSTGSRTTPDVSFVADPATGAWIADTVQPRSQQPVGGRGRHQPVGPVLGRADRAGEPGTRGRRTAGPEQHQPDRDPASPLQPVPERLPRHHQRQQRLYRRGRLQPGDRPGNARGQSPGARLDRRQLPRHGAGAAGQRGGVGQFAGSGEQCRRYSQRDECVHCLDDDGIDRFQLARAGRPVAGHE